MAKEANESVDDLLVKDGVTGSFHSDELEERCVKCEAVLSL